MQGGEPPVQGDHSAGVMGGERDQVGVGHLTMSDDACEVGFFEGDAVGPELVPRLRSHRVEHADGCLCRVSGTDEEPQERALGERTGRQLVTASLEPIEGNTVMDMVLNGEGHEHVPVGEKRAHSTSSSEATSSEVIGRPTDTTGMPRRLTLGGGELSRANPRRINSASTSLMVRRVWCAS